MFSLLWTLIVGLVVGAIAKLLMPGKDPGGILITMGLGVVGSFIGTYVGRFLGYGEGYNAGLRHVDSWSCSRARDLSSDCTQARHTLSARTYPGYLGYAVLHP